MSRHHVAHAGGDKPPLVPLPVDPVHRAHAISAGNHRPPTRSITAAVKATRDRILAMLADRCRTLGETARELGCDLHQAQHALKSLKRDGLVVHEGRSNKSQWRLSDRQRIA